MPHPRAADRSVIAVEDNNDCGSTGVTFTGLYHRG
jgi:hypothetical protein